MSSSTPRETTGALPEWSGIQKTDKNMIIDPILQQYRAVMRAALQEHMNLVTSQYMTGYRHLSRRNGSQNGSELGNAFLGALTLPCYGHIPPRQRPRLRTPSNNVPLSLTRPYALGKLLLFSDLGT